MVIRCLWHHVTIEQRLFTGQQSFSSENVALGELHTRPADIRYNGGYSVDTTVSADEVAD